MVAQIQTANLCACLLIVTNLQGNFPHCLYPVLTSAKASTNRTFLFILTVGSQLYVECHIRFLTLVDSRLYFLSSVPMLLSELKVITTIVQQKASASFDTFFSVGIPGSFMVVVRMFLPVIHE